MKIVLTPLIEKRLDMRYIPGRVSTKSLVGALQAEAARGMPLWARDSPWPPWVQVYDPGRDWTDRPIAGDSRIVMESVLACTRVAGTVKVLYVDPPSSQASDDDGADAADSSLASLRDRLGRCRELLHESGSIFVRSSEASLPGVRRVMDRVLGADNCCGIVTLEKASGHPGELLPAVGDYPVWGDDSAGASLIWYGRDVSTVRYQHLLVALYFQAHNPTVIGEGRERRRRCGILLRSACRRRGLVRRKS